MSCSRTLMGANANESCSHLDEHLSVFDDRGIGLDRNHARRPDDRTGLDIELPAVKIAFDDIAFDEAFRQRARAVRAVIVGHKELAVEVEDGERQIVLLDLEHCPNVHIRSVAEFDLGRHRLSLIELAAPSDHAGAGCNPSRCFGFDSRSTASIMALASATPLPAISWALPCATDENRIELPIVSAATAFCASSLAAICPWSCSMTMKASTPRMRNMVSAPNGPVTAMPWATAASIAGLITSISSRPNNPPSPACGLRPPTAILGAAVPMRLSARSVAAMTRAI